MQCAHMQSLCVRVLVCDQVWHTLHACALYPTNIHLQKKTCRWLTRMLKNAYINWRSCTQWPTLYLHAASLKRDSLHCVKTEAPARSTCHGIKRSAAQASTLHKIIPDFWLVSLSVSTKTMGLSRAKHSQRNQLKEQPTHFILASINSNCIALVCHAHTVNCPCETGPQTALQFWTPPKEAWTQHWPQGWCHVCRKL